MHAAAEPSTGGAPLGAGAAKLVAGAPFAEVLTLPQQRRDNVSGAHFPLVLGCTAAESTSLAAVCEWLATHKAAVEAALVEHGGLYLRGFPVGDAQAFDALMESLGVPPKPYVGGAAVRSVVHGNVFTSNESPPSERIPFHHEMALVAQPPSRIAFFCDTPSPTGGETSILLSTALYARVAAARPVFVERLRAEGLLYHRVLSEEDDPTSAQGRGWRSTYNAHDHASCEAAMRATGVQAWTWLPDGSLRTTTGPLPAFKQDARTGEQVFMNALTAVFLGWTDTRNYGPDSVRFGAAGDALEEGDVHAVRDAMGELAVDIPWQKGDVMLLDNLRSMHARRPFTPPRRILAYLCL